MCFEDLLNCEGGCMSQRKVWVTMKLSLSHYNKRNHGSTKCINNNVYGNVDLLVYPATLVVLSANRNDLSYLVDLLRL